MHRQFKFYMVKIQIGRHVVAQEKVQACSPCKAVELFFQDNSNLFIQNGHPATAFVVTDVGIQFEFDIGGINRRKIDGN